MEFVTKKDVSGCKKYIQYCLRITELCNRDCSYCHYHSGIDYNYEDIIKIVKLCFNHSKNNNRIPLFYFHGGEPTVFKRLKELLISIREYGECEIEIQTNFDKPEFVISLLPYFDLLDISFHFENKNKYLDYKEKLKYFKNKDLRVKMNNVDIMLIENNEKEVLFLRKYFKLLKIKNEITYSYFQGKSFNLDNFNLTENEIIKNDYFEGKYKIPNGFKCDTSNFSIINGNGDIFKCSYALTEKESTGNILKNSQVLDNTMSNTLCPYQTCCYDQAYLKDFD